MFTCSNLPSQFLLPTLLHAQLLKVMTTMIVAAPDVSFSLCTNKFSVGLALLGASVQHCISCLIKLIKFVRNTTLVKTMSVNLADMECLNAYVSKFQFAL